MNKQKQQYEIKKRRARRTRALLHGTATRPRVSVYKRNSYLYIQCIDDDTQTTLVGGSTAAKDLRSSPNKERAAKLIIRVVTAIREKNITAAIFDRGAYRFHGIVKMVAEEFRKNNIRL